MYSIATHGSAHELHANASIFGCHVQGETDCIRAAFQVVRIDAQGGRELVGDPREFAQHQYAVHVDSRGYEFHRRFTMCVKYLNIDGLIRIAHKWAATILTSADFSRWCIAMTGIERFVSASNLTSMTMAYLIMALLPLVERQ